MHHPCSCGADTPCPLPLTSILTLQAARTAPCDPVEERRFSAASRRRSGRARVRSCRIRPARVERTLLSAAFDLDLDFAGRTHGPVRSRGRAALQRRVKKKKIGKGTSSTRAASPLLVWSGHSCPLPLTLILTLISPERVRPCAIPWKSGASTPRQAPKPGTRLQPLRYAPRAHSVIPTGAGAPAQWRDLLSWPLISSRTPTR